MKITLLGTGSPIPDPRRAGPSTLVHRPAPTLLVDCGRGVLMRLTAAGVLPPMLHAVLVTHLHSDHITDLNDVITTHWIMAPEGTAAARLRPAAARRRWSTRILASLAPDLQYRLDHHADLTWTPERRGHRGRPGRRVHRRLGHRHASAPPTTGRSSRPSRSASTTAARRWCSAATACPAPGSTSCASAPTPTCRPSSATTSCAWCPSARLQDILDYHSSVEQAAETAARAGVRTLVLTHYVPSMQPGQEDEWRSRSPPPTSPATIVLGDDLTAVTL